MLVTITKYKDHKEATMGAWKYWHLISFKENGYKYDLTASDECVMHLMDIIKQAGHTLVFEEK